MKIGINKCTLCAVLAIFSATNPVYGEGILKSDTLDVMKEIREQYNLPSLSVAVGVGGDIVFSEAIGFSDVEQ
jgi:hypothetical protein